MQAWQWLQLLIVLQMGLIWVESARFSSYLIYPQDTESHGNAFLFRGCQKPLLQTVYFPRHCLPPLKSYSVWRKDILALTINLFSFFGNTGQNNRKWFWLTCRLDLVKLGNIAQEMLWDELPKFWKMNLTWYVMFLSKILMRWFSVFRHLTFFSSGYECRFWKRIFYLKECGKVCSNSFSSSLFHMLSKLLVFSVINSHS